MAYTTIADIQALVGDVVLNRTFTVSTNPTVTEVDGWIEQVHSEMQLELYTAGFIPDGNEVAPDHRSYGWLKRLATVGVAARILQSRPMQALMNPDLEDTAANRAVNYDREYHRGISKIRQRVLQVTDSFAARHTVRVGSASGDKKDEKPFFRRRQFDYPGIDQDYDEERYGSY